MSSLAKIVRDRHGSAGSNRAWSVTRAGDQTYPLHDGDSVFGHVIRPAYTLWHYSTAMLTWCDTGYGVDVLHVSTGHGSTSDQNGMNTAFRVLGLSLYFSRRNGASISKVES